MGEKYVRLSFGRMVLHHAGRFSLNKWVKVGSKRGWGGDREYVCVWEGFGGLERGQHHRSVVAP